MLPVGFKPGWQVSKKVGRPCGVGYFVMGYSFVGDDDPVAGIWQNRMSSKGKIPVKMKFYTPTNPNSPSQQSWRSWFAMRMSEWSSFDETTKNKYRERAKRRNMTPWGLYIRDYRQSHP